MEKRELLFEGNEKRVFATDDPTLVIFGYKDVMLAFNGIKRAVLRGKGELSNAISALLLDRLNQEGVNTHFVRRIGAREQLCRKIEIIPLELSVRNRLAGPMAERLGVADGTTVPCTVFDLRYNNDELGDPFLSDTHALALGLVSKADLKQMYTIAERSNKILRSLFHQAGIELVDMKIEFGRAADTGEIIISDELSPDTCRLWDERDGRRLDKDRFRLDMGDVVAAYREVFERLSAVVEAKG